VANDEQEERTMRVSRIAAAGLVVLLACVSRAATLEVGAGKAFARIEEAVGKAAAGDEIVVYPAADGAEGVYRKAAVLVRTPRLTLRAADAKGFVQIDGTGFDYSGSGHVPRAIFQFDPAAKGCVLEGFELSGAHNGSFNGAGVRINQANDVVIRRCKIHDNDMGIMSNGSVAAGSGAGQLIEGCTITDNGTTKDPGYNHNLYLGGTSVTVRGCEIARSITGHNLKSRAHLNVIEYNYIHDSANRELDLVDEKGNTDAPGSDTILLGNFIVKRTGMDGNKTVIHFGQDGGHDHVGAIFLIHNTIVTPYVSPVLDIDAAGVAAHFINNVVSDAGAHQAGVLAAAHKGATLEKVDGQGNVLARAFAAGAGGVKGGDLAPVHVIELDRKLDDPMRLMEFKGVGEVVPRVKIEAGAGDYRALAARPKGQG
jgi:hypothetical protein